MLLLMAIMVLKEIEFKFKLYTDTHYVQCVYICIRTLFTSVFILFFHWVQFNKSCASSTLCEGMNVWMNEQDHTSFHVHLYYMSLGMNEASYKSYILTIRNRRHVPGLLAMTIMWKSNSHCQKSSVTVAPFKTDTSSQNRSSYLGVHAR